MNQAGLLLYRVHYWNRGRCFSKLFSPCKGVYIIGSIMIGCAKTRFSG